jgi:LysR family transcriptional activator of nhaA
LNYQHLFYFKTVAAVGGITAAAERLRLTPPTLSAQIRALEDALGVTLFERTARGMTLTEHGQIALRYADRIFALGSELEEALRPDRTRIVRVGVESSIVAATVRPLLARLARANENERVVCTFGTHAALLGSLGARDLDIVLTEAHVTASNVVSKLVAETEVAFFANIATAEALRPGFPGSLHGKSFVAPPKNASFREAIEGWLAGVGVRLSVNIEIEDASLAAALATDGVGLVAAPLSAELELRKRYDLALVGVLSDVHAKLYAVGAASTLDRLLAPADPIDDEDTSARERADDDELGPTLAAAPS